MLRKKAQLVFLDLETYSKVNVNNYTLHFENNTKVLDPISIVSKLMLMVFALVVMVTPLSEFVVTLKPAMFFQVWTCVLF
ncbi:hypothetical protein [Winogradskyella sp. PC D3.3]